MKRRTLLLGSAAGLLAACRTTTTSAPQKTPIRGGRLRVGMVGAGKSESFNPSTAVSAIINMARVCAVFDPLVDIGPNLDLRPALATEWSHDASARKWTFKLRSGVLWHDGKPFTADDVVYSLRWMAEPDNQLSAAVANVAKSTAVNPGTVLITLKQPDLMLPHALGGTWIIQKGTTDFARPVGTGPFVFESLTPGQRSVCKRNPHYWSPGKPYVDELVIQSIDDDTARVNALLGGQLDVLCQMPFSQAKVYERSTAIRLLNSPSVAAQAFYLAVDKPPFDDVRVRQALRLLVDRKQLVDVALHGYGTVANDLFGSGMQYYLSALPQRQRDVAKAKALLAEAGQANLTITLETSAVAPGMVEAAALFAQQAKEGGVTIKVTQVDSASYFDPTVQYLKRPFGQTFWAGFSSLSGFYQYAVLPDAPGNETHWHNDHTTSLYNAAISATDPAAAAEAWGDLQQEQYDSGGYIWWANINNVDAVSSRVGGITPSRYLSIGLPSGLANAYLTA